LTRFPRQQVGLFLFLGLFLLPWMLGGQALGQDRLKKMPGQEQFEKVSKEIPKSVKFGSLVGTWKDGGKSIEYSRDGKRWVYDIAAQKESEAGERKDEGNEKGGMGRRGFGTKGPARGRQAGTTLSPDGKSLASHKNRNVELSSPEGKDAKKITTDGDEKKRIKNGVASWVYGEELFQRSAMWWSPDSKKLAFYRFDESKVKDYFVLTNQVALQNKVETEAYPKAGTENPVVDLLVYDTETGKTVKLDVRDGKPFTNDSIGHYVYAVSWSPDSKEVRFFRTNRLQKAMEYVGADPVTGKCRVIVHEEWQPSWVENLPENRFLKDNKRFIWASQRSGFKNYYLYDVSGSLIAPLTNHPFEVANIVQIDEERNLLFYMARSGDNPMKLQLHKVGLDGKGDTRLTDPMFHHTINPAPDSKHFLDIAQTHDQAPFTRLIDDGGKVIAELAKSDVTQFEKLGLKKVELFTYKAADQKTDLYGMLNRPSNFDPNKKYPLLISVYAGPETNGARETFALPPEIAEYGFLVASLDSRTAAGRGKAILDAIYGNVGVIEVDDQAEGVKELAKRPYVDGKRVGIFGASYGGSMSALCLLRHPDLFHAGSASSAVTDYRNYDTIYTERYLGLPQESKKAYEQTNMMPMANKLKGRLMVFFGTADDNVHPSNSLQLISAFLRAGKSIEVQVGADQGHAGLNRGRMMEFFIENLVLKPAS